MKCDSTTDLIPLYQTAFPSESIFGGLPFPAV